MISHSTLWRLACAVTLLASALCDHARGEIILDDFDDSAKATSPEMEEVFVNTSDVGDLRAARSIRVIGSAADPVSSLDANTTSASTLTAQLSSINAHVLGVTQFAFQFNYTFSPKDVSQNGANNAIVFDFISLHGNAFLPNLGLIVRDDTNLSSSYFSELRSPELPLDSGPVSIVMPFASFTHKSGSPGLPDFKTFKEMDFDLFFLSPPADVRWSAQLGRIRFARVPEHQSLVLALFGATIVLRLRVPKYSRPKKEFLPCAHVRPLCSSGSGQCASERVFPRR